MRGIVFGRREGFGGQSLRQWSYERKAHGFAAKVYARFMGGLLESVTRDRRVLVAVAAPAEARAVLGGFGGANADPDGAETAWKLVAVSDRFDVVVTGVGKANAAGAVARVTDPARHGAVLSVGVAGALPRGGAELPLRATVAAQAAA